MKKILLVNIFLMLVGVGYSQISGVRFEPDVRISDSVAASFNMDPQMFAYMALVASGTSDENLQTYLETLENLVNKFSATLEKKLSNEEIADRALMFIYENVLKKYSLLQTRVDTALETGVYNCVSATTLFMYFAKVLGIPAVAIETPAHAFCTIESNGNMIDVEATNPYGVNPGKKREKELPNGGTQYMVVPVSNYNGRQEVDDRRLLAMIYQNRISVLQKKKDDAPTIGLAVDAWVLQAKSPKSVQTLCECVCNYAGTLTAAGKDQEGLVLVMQAREIFGENPNYSAYIETATYNILVDKVEKLPLDAALVEVREKKDALSQKNYANLISYAYNNAARHFAQKHDWANAIKMSEEGLAEIPYDASLKKAVSVYKQNYAIEFHNKAAELYNKGDKEAALETVKEGLRIVPDSSVLKKDLNSMK